MVPSVGTGQAVSFTAARNRRTQVAEVDATSVSKPFAQLRAVGATSAVSAERFDAVGDFTVALKRRTLFCGGVHPLRSFSAIKKLLLGLGYRLIRDSVNPRNVRRHVRASTPKSASITSASFLLTCGYGRRYRCELAPLTPQPL